MSEKQARLIAKDLNHYQILLKLYDNCRVKNQNLKVQINNLELVSDNKEVLVDKYAVKYTNLEARYRILEKDFEKKKNTNRILTKTTIGSVAVIVVLILIM